MTIKDEQDLIRCNLMVMSEHSYHILTFVNTALPQVRNVKTYEELEELNKAINDYAWRIININEELKNTYYKFWKE